MGYTPSETNGVQQQIQWKYTQTDELHVNFPSVLLLTSLNSNEQTPI